MFDLKCKRKGCVYNKNCNCTAKKVEVTKNTSCQTYEPSNEAEVGEVEKVGQPPIRKNIEVDCKAECIFNENQVCTANGITVQTCKDKTCPICCTFEPE
jgi:hypothetical protein